MSSGEDPLTGLLRDIRRLPGRLYELLWRGTTGEPWTHIMRRHGWYFVVPAVIMMAVMAWARRRYGGWVVGLAVGVAALLGFVAGHVFW